MTAESRERFSIRHAYAMLFSLLLTWLGGSSMPIAICTLFSLGFWLWELRDEFTGLADFGAANVVTSVRALSLLGLAASIDARAAGWAAGWSLFIFTLDGVDGQLARRANKETLFGARFDSETDASLMLLLSGGVVLLGRAGIWAWVAGLLRFVYVLALHWSQRPDITPPSSRFGRHAFGFSVTLFTCCLWPFTSPMSEVLALLATASLCHSFSRSFRSIFAPRSLGQS